MATWNISEEELRMVEAAGNFVCARTSFVLHVDDTDGMSDLGSGVFVRIASRVFLATAAHVIANRGWLRTRGYFFVSDIPPYDVGRTPIALCYRGGDSDPDEEWDLGWLEVAEDLPSQLGRTPIELAQIDIAWEPQDGARMFLCGSSPDLRSESADADGKPMYEMGIRAVMVGTKRPETIVGATPREQDIFLSYLREPYGDLERNLVAPVSPKGLSGGGVWAVNWQEGQSWDPSMIRLVGITRGDNVGHEWIRATRIRHWLDLVRDGASRNVLRPKDRVDS